MFPRGFEGAGTRESVREGHLSRLPLLKAAGAAISTTFKVFFVPDLTKALLGTT